MRKVLFSAQSFRYMYAKELVNLKVYSMLGIKILFINIG